MEIPKCIDLGPGPWKKKGFFGIDIRPFWAGENPDKNLEVDADMFHDLNSGIPFPSNTIEEICASHFMEHVANIYFMLDECHRVLQPKGILEIIVPLFETKSVDHVTCFYPDWFERNISLQGARYANKFNIIYKEVKLVNLPEEFRAVWVLTIRLEVLK